MAKGRAEAGAAILSLSVSELRPAEFAAESGASMIGGRYSCVQWRDQLELREGGFSGHCGVDFAR
jgi:hypothetical protein